MAFHERKAGDRGAREGLETPLPEVQPDGEGFEVRTAARTSNISEHATRFEVMMRAKRYALTLDYIVGENILAVC